MNIFMCRYCGQERKNKKSLVGHETFCQDNPNRKPRDTEAARRKSREQVDCRWCKGSYSRATIRKHQSACVENPEVIDRKTKECPVCGKKFMSDSTTCSYSCSNKYFRHGEVGGCRYVDDDVLVERKSYRHLCFRYHAKKCVVCGEENIVAVHHLNENHNDNRPENLIPLCPTHHQYCHSNYKNLVADAIEKYIASWKLAVVDEEAGSGSWLPD